jgi:hypothetical protein
MIREGDHPRIIGMIDKLNLEAKGLIQNALEISYFSRGAWSYQAVLNMSAVERDMASEFINKRLETAAKMPFPVF